MKQMISQFLLLSQFSKSVNKVLEILGEHVKISENMVVQQIFISRMRMRTSQQFNQKNLNSLILEAGSQVLRNPMSVNLDEIYVAKILGVDSRKSCVVRGILLKSDDPLGEWKMRRLLLSLISFILLSR
ncbi:uncharacterized protein LOC110230320 [Arabidopsis lyrata subsp. lyrata]|uniref:uncharacterized protein LOC110230320 n=1 Tax=Arabidopsis lyrata subsp. lyrata TaxID=81972 RepID=UPI000A29ADB7|nr:uncharacterized protein LOC110230320 [Arabidopsis lyrata subsp. lyrata]|eukprot:XP_020888526.1 uncharacterized protein LOC110230320 [Arabidopsis lyrata subsp. lyrata]